MTTYTKFKEYIWLVNTIRRAGRITLAEINERWMVPRMAVQSFAKRVSMWRPDNAPVTGSRFQDYLNIALMMGRMLGGEEA